MPSRVMILKPTILVFNKFYLPGYRAGGPVRTLVNVVAGLGDEFNFHIVTLDRDVGDSEPYSGVKTGVWTPIEKAKVLYLAESELSVNQLAILVARLSPDLLYLNSFFDPTFTQRILWARRWGKITGIPVVIAPRGEFSAGALRLKQWKKRAYLQVSRVAGLYSGLIWHASSPLEQAAILRELSFVTEDQVQVALDLPPMEATARPEPHVRRTGEPLKLCFLSRISPMKNLDFALRALMHIEADVVLTIYGPKSEPAYWADCERLIAALPANVRVDEAGELHPTEVKARLAQHDLFLFPTRGENYGHVIHEALMAGLPVLISDQTPWQQVVDRGVGWVLSLDSELAFARQIDDYAAWPATQVAEIKGRAQAYAQEVATRPEVIDANRQLFLSAMGRVVS